MLLYTEVSHFSVNVKYRECIYTCITPPLWEAGD
jgi:hypothetical protein